MAPINKHPSGSNVKKDNAKEAEKKNAEGAAGPSNSDKTRIMQRADLCKPSSSVQRKEEPAKYLPKSDNPRLTLSKKTDKTKALLPAEKAKPTAPRLKKEESTRPTQNSDKQAPAAPKNDERTRVLKPADKPQPSISRLKKEERPKTLPKSDVKKEPLKLGRQEPIKHIPKADESPRKLSRPEPRKTQPRKAEISESGPSEKLTKFLKISKAPSHCTNKHTAPQDKIFAERQTKTESLPPKEKEEQIRWAKSKLSGYAGACPASFTWHRIRDGFRCSGGSHFVSDELLAEGKGGMRCPKIELIQQGQASGDMITFIMNAEISLEQTDGPYYPDPQLGNRGVLRYCGEVPPRHPKINFYAIPLSLAQEDMALVMRLANFNTTNQWRYE